MRKKLKILLMLLFLAIIFSSLVVFLKLNAPPAPISTFRRNPQVATESAFAKELRMIQKQVEEEQKKAQEEARKAEEQRKFLATYGPCRWIPILLYHHIDDKPGSLYVDTQTFTSQMNYLVEKGYTTMTLPEVVADLPSGQFPPKPVALTFDDGYRDMYNNAYPVLRERNLKATFFLITQLMEGGDYLTWQQAREMAGNPLVTIGDHTLSHRPLPALSDEDIKSEILSSKGILEGQLGVKINVFAYPYGSYTPRADKYLQEGGFAAAVGTQYGVSCARLPYDLRRVRIGRAQLSSYGL